ncbi:MAG: response regulator transcription factor [Chloroflexi bacterium]|nr:response regulator transcription factor [Chloroflexota bacterium]
MRVLLVDDYALFRDGVASLLATRGYQVVGQASDGAEALVKARELKPDLVLMDIRMPRVGGLEATRLIKAVLPEVKVVMLTVSDDEADLFEAIKSGAQGYLLKDMKAEAFFDLLAAVERGEAGVSPRMAAYMLEEFTRLSSGRKAGESATGLSEREGEVLRLVAQGRTNKEVAAALYISENTVKYHLRNILDKLHLENRAQVVAYAARRGLANYETKP